MSLASWWRRVDASRGVSWALAVYVLFISWRTLWVAFVGWLAGMAWLALIPGAFAAAGCALAVAWQRERQWAWSVLVVLVGLQLLARGGSLLVAGASASGVIGLGVLLLLALLLHSDSRARIEPPAVPSRSPSWRVGP